MTVDRGKWVGLKRLEMTRCCMLVHKSYAAACLDDKKRKIQHFSIRRAFVTKKLQPN